MGILATIGGMLVLGGFGSAGLGLAFGWCKRNGIISTIFTGFSIQFMVYAFYRFYVSTTAFVGDLNSGIKNPKQDDSYFLFLAIGLGLFAIGCLFSFIHMKTIQS